MDIDTLRINILNITALTLQLMPVETIVAILVGATAITINVLKIITWFRHNRQK